ncbi:hypothetical protein J3A78_003529 [Streptomyces sp. PvR006]|nr:hypothetical protein [Streptomyces sp. PvR006]
MREWQRQAIYCLILAGMLAALVLGIAPEGSPAPA